MIGIGHLRLSPQAEREIEGQRQASLGVRQRVKVSMLGHFASYCQLFLPRGIGVTTPSES